jgi:hypothetical protein
MKLSPVKTLDSATKAGFSHPQEGTALRWWLDAPERFYRPYVTEVVSRNNNSLTFRFLNLVTNAVLGAQHTIDLDDETVVWRRLPSTVDAPTVTPGQCVLLFLNEEALSDPLGGDARESRRDPQTQALLETGKWPKSASEISARLLEQVSEVKRAVALLQVAACSPDDDALALSDRISRLSAIEAKLNDMTRALGAL